MKSLLSMVIGLGLMWLFADYVFINYGEEVFMVYMVLGYLGTTYAILWNADLD